MRPLGTPCLNNDNAKRFFFPQNMATFAIFCPREKKKRSLCTIRTGFCFGCENLPKKKKNTTDDNKLTGNTCTSNFQFALIVCCEHQTSSPQSEALVKNVVAMEQIESHVFPL